jgi:hypothetical protein
MKFDAKTVTVLKNFSSINPSILFKKGKIVKTVSPTKSILAIANIDQEFEKEFAIFDVPRLLGTMSLFNEPDIEFLDSALKIKNAERELTYRYAAPTAIIAPPDKNIALPSEDVTFTLTSATLSELQKAAGALSMPEIAVLSDNNKLYLQATDSKNFDGDSYRICVGEADKKFRFVFKAENIKVIPQDYQVTISSSNISRFTGKSVVDIVYWIALEKNASSFG